MKQTLIVYIEVTANALSAVNIDPFWTIGFFRYGTSLKNAKLSCRFYHARSMLRVRRARAAQDAMIARAHEAALALKAD